MEFSDQSKERHSMTDQQINVAVAELCGWEFCDKARTHNGRLDTWTIPQCRHPRWTLGIWRPHARLLQYVSSTDACQEFEQTKELDWQRYLLELFRVTNPHEHTKGLQIHVQNYLCRNLVTASGRQRCEAFLKLNNITL